MTPAARTGHRDWLEVAGERAALPRGLRRADFAERVTRELLVDRNAEVHAILAQQSSAARVSSWGKLFRQTTDMELLELLAYRPQDAICVLGAGLPEERRWSTLTEIYEACYALAAQGASDTGPGSGMPYAWRLSMAHLARTRWVLLSLPFSAASRPPERDLRRVDGDTGRLVALAQQARDDWLGVLAAIEDYPQLAARIGDIEADAVTITASGITSARLWPGAARKTAAADDCEDPVGREAARIVVTRLLLPRFAWTTAVSVYRQSAGWLSLALTAAACLAVLAVVVQLALGFFLGWTSEYTAAAITAIAVYLLVACAMAVDPPAAWPWLLRQPASAAVGLLALAAFGPGWWYTGGARGDTVRAVGAAAGLAVAALGYLYVEAIGHGVGGRRLARRPPLVSLLGLIHGLLVSLIGLRFLLPIFAASPQNGPALSCWYAARSCHGMALPVPALLGLAAAWSLAAGVFLQIIWDDEPVTAPLAHVSWHRGG